MYFYLTIKIVEDPPDCFASRLCVFVEQYNLDCSSKLLRHVKLQCVRCYAVCFEFNRRYFIHIAYFKVSAFIFNIPTKCVKEPHIFLLLLGYIVLIFRDKSSLECCILIQISYGL
jgi:hypothetical protein